MDSRYSADGRAPSASGGAASAPATLARRLWVLAALGGLLGLTIALALAVLPRAVPDTGDRSAAGVAAAAVQATLLRDAPTPRWSLQPTLADSALAPADRERLTLWAGWLQGHPGLRVVLTLHPGVTADATASARRSLAAALRCLALAGVDPHRVTLQLAAPEVLVGSPDAPAAVPSTPSPAALEFGIVPP